MAIRALKAPSVLLMGAAGAGKTTAIGSMVAAGIETFVISTEPNGIDSLLDGVKMYGGDVSKLHYKTISPAPAGWAALKEMAKVVHNMGYEDITKLKAGVGKQHANQLSDLLDTFNDFVDERTGESFGDVSTWGDDRALFLDSLSGLNKIAMDHTIGLKPAAHQGEWGVAMNLEENIIYKLAADCYCYFGVLAHVDKVTNEVTGIPSITAAALGNKLAPKLARLFSEIVYQKREGSNFFWSTAETNIDVKNRGLPIDAKLKPDFRQLVAIHEARKAHADS